MYKISRWRCSVRCLVTCPCQRPTLEHSPPSNTARLPSSILREFWRTELRQSSPRSVRDLNPHFSIRCSRESISARHLQVVQAPAAQHRREALARLERRPRVVLRKQQRSGRVFTAHRPAAACKCELRFSCRLVEHLELHQVGCGHWLYYRRRWKLRSSGSPIRSQCSDRLCHAQ